MRNLLLIIYSFMLLQLYGADAPLASFDPSQQPLVEHTIEEDLPHSEHRLCAPQSHALIGSRSCESRLHNTTLRHQSRSHHPSVRRFVLQHTTSSLFNATLRHHNFTHILHGEQHPTRYYVYALRRLII